MGQGKHQMKIRYRQQFSLSVVQPLLLCHGLAFGAVAVSAGVIGILGMTATVAELNMPSPGSCAAGNYLVDKSMNSTPSCDTGSLFGLIKNLLSSADGHGFSFIRTKKKIFFRPIFPPIILKF